MTVDSLPDTIDLISDDSTEIDGSGETSDICARNDEISEAVYHLEKDSNKHQRHLTRQKNGFNMFLSGYLNDASEETWGQPSFLVNNGHWSSNDFPSNSDNSYLRDDITFTDSNSNIHRLHEKRSRLSESLPVSESWRDNFEGRGPNICSPYQRSATTSSAPFERAYSQNLPGARGGNTALESFGNQEDTLSLLAQSGCVKLDDSAMFASTPGDTSGSSLIFVVKYILLCIFSLHYQRRINENVDNDAFEEA
ncbi:unnamed protein product [Dibothriocephalus latus]|uniref:Uncharacterized protein n=1 Tax=Dibothriocephalus latus TaxID=60516 RepID=A0A3P7L3Q3_DIBLA|nr:unnamed protein product [Dibothriocephalus latus]